MSNKKHQSNWDDEYDSDYEDHDKHKKRGSKRNNSQRDMKRNGGYNQYGEGSLSSRHSH